MKKWTGICILAAFLSVTGCDSGKPGGPGATKPTSSGVEQRAEVSKVKETEQKVLGATENTIMVDVPMLATDVKQGGTAPLEIEIDRGKNMSGDVSLSFDGLPAGVSIDPASPIVLASESKANLTVSAMDSAVVGEYTVNVKAHPPSGVDATNLLKIKVEQK
jgi:hypothetical protein